MCFYLRNIFMDLHNLYDILFIMNLVEVFMIYQTHVHIAELVLKSLNTFQKTYISSSEFIKGSNHPDYDFKYRRIKHQFEDSLDSIRKLLKEVTTESMSRYERGFKMGIVAHFLADYMCSYHSNPYYVKKNLAVHIRYEQKLHALTLDTQFFDKDLFHSQNIDTMLIDIAQFITSHKQTVEISAIDDFRHALSLVYRMVHMCLDQIVPTTILDTYNPTKIVIFTDTYYPQINGVSNTIYHYTKYLEQQHIPYLLVAPKYDNKTHHFEESPHIIRIRSFSFMFYKESKMALPNVYKLNQIIADFKPTNIHVMTEFFIGHFGLRFGKKHNIPVVSNYSTHFVTYLDYLKLKIFKKPLTKYVTWFHNQASLTTCPSHETKTHLQVMGIKRVSLFGRGIHTQQFSPTFRDATFRRTFHENPFIYLYVGRVSAEKELELGLEAFRQLKKTFDHVIFLVVGDGPKKELYQNLYPEVNFLGYLVKETLSKVYASSDVFVFPSPTETLGNVVLEAMASGLPVIVANQGGVLDNVKHLENGMIAHEQSVEAYYEHMKTYLLDHQHYKMTQQHALKHVKKKSWKTIFNDQIQMHQLLRK
jgi:glycosyltransferase involved in cell wall biosynthesis